jgi:photosystem II stability/assembly factor-like uncharacterized protein
MNTKTAPALLSAILVACLCTSAARAATWRSIGPEGGTVTALAFAPSDSRVAYAGTLGGGVFRSQDGGSTWTAASGGLGSLFVESLAVDPGDSQIAFAGTIEGLYETTSGGASWTLLPVGSFPQQVVERVVIDPTRPNVLVAAGSSGLFCSPDGGAQWTECDAGLPGPQVSALYLDPDHPGTLYASVASATAAVAPTVYKTVDGGASWTVLEGLQTEFAVDSFARLAGTATLYASTFEGIFATRDGGATWTSVYTVSPSTGPITTLVAAPSGALYGTNGGGGGVVASDDGGKTWEDLAPGAVMGQAVSLAVDRQGDHVLAGSFYAGIFSLEPGSAWTQANHGLRATQITGVAVSAADPPVLYVATYGGGIFASVNGGADFIARNRGLPLIDGVDVFSFGLATSPRAPSSLAIGFFFGADANVAQSFNGGRHWTHESSICMPTDVLALDPPAIYIASTSAFAFPPKIGGCPGPVSCTAQISRNGGATFACLNGPEAVSAYLVDPLRPAVVYAAAGDVMWKSVDHGAHFSSVAGSLGMTVVSLAASPAAHETLYAGGSAGVLKSTDGGRTWAPAGSLPTTGFNGVAALLVDPANPALVYAGVAGRGVFHSRDGGASWRPLGAGFPGLFSFNAALALDASHHVLYAGTQGNGVWALDLP